MRISGTAICLLAVAICFASFHCLPLQATGEPSQQLQYFPQFADGGGYTTTWSFTGYGFGATTITVEIFDRNGSPLAVPTDLGTNSRFVLSIDTYGTALLRTLGAGSSPLSGWVRVSSSQPVGVSETYQYVGSNGVTSKATVFASSPVISATLFAADARNTAIALLNTGASTTAINFTLLDKNGRSAGTSSYALNAGSQVALYLNQLPGFENSTALGGSVELHGTAPFSVVTLTFEGQEFATAPVLPGRSEPASYRNGLISLFESLVQQVKVTGDQLLPPAEEDLTAFAGFLSLPQTGIIRLLPRETYDGYLTIIGGGAYYSFARQDHAYGNGSDISLEQGYLSVGFAGTDFGFLTSLGDMPIDGVTLDLPAVQYLASFSPPTTEADARAQYQRASQGFSVGPYDYRNRIKAAQATTFALRSICYGSSDVLVAFRVVRLDIDGSAILVWRLMQSFSVPKLQ